MEEYVFRLTTPELASYFWIAVCVLGAGWLLAVWRLVPLARRAVRARQPGVALAACTLSACPLLIAPTVHSRIYEQSLTVRVAQEEVVATSLFGTYRIRLDRQLGVRRNGDKVVVSDGQEHITLPAGRTWRLQYPFMNTDELLAEILSRSL